MNTVAFTIPLLPDMTDTDRRVMNSCWRGERRTDYEASRRRLGITREGVWIQPGPDGDLAIAVVEAADLPAALGGISSSQAPFDRWFRDHCRTVHGVDLEAGFPPPELVLDFRA